VSVAGTNHWIPSSSASAHRRWLTNSGGNHVQTRTGPGAGGHGGGHEPGRHDRHRPGLSQRRTGPATAHRTSSRGVLAPPPGRLARAARRGRRPPAAAGPRALLHPQRDTRPADRPSAARTQPPTQPARRFPRWVRCRSGAGGRAGRARRQTGGPQSPSRARGLTTVTVTPLDGAAAPTRQPHRLAGDGLRAYLAAGKATHPCESEQDC
jgi:hypothetical protein